MRGREFLELAREIVAGRTEKHWRGALGRAYYALMLECRDALRAWGFVPGPRENAHPFTRLRFVYHSDADMNWIGLRLDRLSQLRNAADYNLAALRDFASDAVALQAIRDVTDALARLDAILADAARVAAITADIRARWP
jgi:hypothetical protein